MSYFLFLDDERRFESVKFPDSSFGREIKRARNYAEFCHILDNYGLPAIVSFDFDLSLEHYRAFNKVQSGEFNPKNFSAKTGADCAIYFIEYLRKHNLDMPTVYCHSMNPKGKSIILGLIDKFRKEKHAPS